jgi:hypothetical protein
VMGSVMHSLNLIMWAMDLAQAQPLQRLAALFLAYRGSWISDEPKDDSEDPWMTADIGLGALWVGCTEDEFVAAVTQLRNFGLLLGEIRAGAVTFCIPLEKFTSPSVPVKRVERQISIYVISAGGRSKVGISAEPANRLYGLQGANPLMKLVLEFSRSGPSSLIRRIERDAHSRLTDRAIGNEWFSVTPAEAIRVVTSLFGEEVK